ncbi:alpha/beta hydrolase [Pantanalinema rosaneae CENA516]|uniref:alpha/beta hydrolase n=1 Tax=Pantanalinema rosaneae TaxID=1620701 RepID=UPI003D6F5398
MQKRNVYSLLCLLGAIVVTFVGSYPLAADPLTEPFVYDRQQPLDIQIAAVRTDQNLKIYDLTYASPAGGRVPAYLVAKAGTGSFAGVLMLHGVEGSRDTSLNSAKELARAGAVVLAVSAPFARPGYSGRPGSPLTFTERDREYQIQIIQDLQRGVDLLLDRPEVDPQRLAFVGYSYGGSMGGLLAGIERRIKAYGLMVASSGSIAFCTVGQRRHCNLNDIPPARRQPWLKAMQPIEPIRYIGHAAPATLLFLNGRHDQVIEYADASAFQQAASQPKQVKWYDAGHGLPPEAIRDLYVWLAEQIQLNLPQS